METLAALALIGFARLVTGVRATWAGCTPEAETRVYFANHASHSDAVILWTVLPPALRAVTRPVAGADYWRASATRRFLAERVFRAVLIERVPRRHQSNPVQAMAEALSAGSSLILFPEGTRNTGSEPLLPFKSGLHHLALRSPGIPFVPVWIDNPGRVMPKGEFLPVPLLCTATFGTPLQLEPGEDRAAFLARARASLLALAPRRPGEKS
jgi:1-acyl-sn-glycerol-3-phosphate acyltransferase